MNRLLIVSVMWTALAAAGHSVQAVQGESAGQPPVAVETTPASEPQIVEEESSGGRIMRYALIGAVVGGVVGGVMSLFGKKKTKT